MNLKTLTGLLLLTSLVACGPETLQSTYEKAQREDGMDGFNIIHIEENEQYGLVISTSWTEQYMENKDRPGIKYYEKMDGKWIMHPGTDCGTGRSASTLGIMGGSYVYCGVITEQRPFVKMTVGETEAQIFDVKNGRYFQSKYMASFAGFFPADRPLIAGIVVLEEPQPIHYGGLTAGPAFRRIAARLLAVFAWSMFSPTDFS